MAIHSLPSAEESTGDDIVAEINITPLTDIFLVLLIIFIVTSSVQVETASKAGLKVNLPKGTTKEIDPGAKSLTISISKANEILVEGQPVEAGDRRLELDRGAACAEALGRAAGQPSVGRLRFGLREDDEGMHGASRPRRCGERKIAIAHS